MKNIHKLLLFLTVFTGLCGSYAYAEDTSDADDSLLESYNRSMFTFNGTVDEYVMKPVAKGYRAITTDFIRRRVRNFFSNIKEPVSTVNHALQGNITESGKSAGRFLVNTTLGLLGTFDVADGWQLKKNKTGFDATMAKWCVPDGAFFVLPLLGPSTPRAAVGMAVDTTADPTYWADYYANFGNDVEKYSFYYGLTALGFISLREENLELLDSLTADSVDAYSAIKSAYLQNRLKLNVCGSEDSLAQNTSYDFDFDEEDDED
jgi:phospholipid-binding lipoprotein MlaA